MLPREASTEQRGEEDGTGIGELSSCPDLWSTRSMSDTALGVFNTCSPLIIYKVDFAVAFLLSGLMGI